MNFDDLMIMDDRYNEACHDFEQAVMARTADREPGEIDIVMLGLFQKDNDAGLIMLDMPLEELFEGDYFIFESNIDAAFGDGGDFQRPWFFGIAVPTLTTNYETGQQRQSIAYAMVERLVVKMARFATIVDGNNQLRIVSGPSRVNETEADVLMEFVAPLRKHVTHQG